MNKLGFLIFLLLFLPVNHALAQEFSKPLLLIPKNYQVKVALAIKKAGKNSKELLKAIDAVDAEEREGLAFLIAYMPVKDLRTLSAEFLKSNVHLAYQGQKGTPWEGQIPKDIFLNDVLPYASVNERRDDWRSDFYERFIKTAQQSKTIDDAVLKLNQYVYENLKVSYSATKRPKPDQSPYESIKAGYASCTGLSILLVDALRSVGIPARIAGIALWADGSGNHTWVEVWNGQWHHIGASEPTGLDHAWFTQKADSTDSKHRIFVTSFKKTELSFPMRWASGNKSISALDVTADYTHQKWNTL